MNARISLLFRLYKLMLLTVVHRQLCCLFLQPLKLHKETLVQNLQLHKKGNRKLTLNFILALNKFLFITKKLKIWLFFILSTQIFQRKYKLKKLNVDLAQVTGKNFFTLRTTSLTLKYGIDSSSTNSPYHPWKKKFYHS